MQNSLEVTWSELKDFVDARLLSIQWVEISDNYYLSAFDGPFSLTCVIPKVASPAVDTPQKIFEDSYKTAGNKSFSDADGTTVLRPKAAKKGWTFSLVPFEVTTAKKTSALVSKLVDNTDRTGITCKIYDSNDAEITDAANEGNTVKTVIDFEPTYDYEIVGGQVQQTTIPASDVRVWVTAVPDISAGSGGSKEMVGGVNLKYIDPTDKVHADGRVSKYMSYNATYHTNKLRFTIRHNAGLQHSVLIVLELFRD